MLDRTPVGRFGDILLDHQTARGNPTRFQVLIVRADVADMREGESDDLPGIGRVGQSLLIPGHAGVEAHLAHRVLRRRVGAEATAPEHGAIGQNQSGGGTGGHIGHGGFLSDGFGLQIGQGKSGRGNHARPVTGRDEAGLTPLTHGFGADARQARGSFGPAEAVDDEIDAD